MRVMPVALVLLLWPVTAGAGEPQAVPPAPAAAAKAKPAAKAGKPPAAKKLKPGAADPTPIPPAVLTGDGELVCDINARENGHQKLTILDGGGLEFDVAVSPIVDGTVTTAGPEKGGSYKFTSHLASKAAKAKLPGVGEFELDELETKVMVEMTRYKQPAGKGTALTFTSADMARRGIYVEFAGRGHAKNGEQYSFRVNLGAPSNGSGKVVPADDNRISNMNAKVVKFRAPTTTVLVTTTFDRVSAK
jgi:hypothetical protein